MTPPDALCRFQIALVAVLVLAGVLACGTDERPEHLATVRDSLGIQVVEYPASVRDLPVAFRISEIPRLDLGGPRNDPNQELSSRGPFHNAIRLSDGRYVVPDFDDLKVFDPEGHHLFTLGRPGEGPGEFRQVLAACAAPGDSIIAIHYGGGRVSVFDDAGTHVRTFRLPNDGTPGSSCFDDGSLVSSTDRRPDPAGGPLDMVTTLSRVAQDGTTVEVIGVVPAWPAVTFPFLPAEASGVVAHGAQLYVGLGLSPEVRVYELDGTLARIIRWREPRIPFTDRVLADLVSAGRFGIQVMRPEGPADMFELMRDQPRLDSLPVYRRLKVDAVGRTWLEDHPYISESPLLWTVFDSSGHPLGRVRVPEVPGALPGVHLGEIGEDEVVLIWRDEALGFVHVSLHALDPVGRTH